MSGDVQKNSKNEKRDILVLGSIDQKKAWKLNLYQEPDISEASSESHDYIKVGEVIWIILSEKRFYLTSCRKGDPFVEE